MMLPNPSLLSCANYLLLLLPAAVQVTAAPAPAAPAPAVLEARATYVGGVDMVALCHEQWGKEWRAILYGNTTNDWKCWSVYVNVAGPINVDKYCKQHYGGNTYASAPGGGTYDWGCYRN